MQFYYFNGGYLLKYSELSFSLKYFTGDTEGTEALKGMSVFSQIDRLNKSEGRSLYVFITGHNGLSVNCQIEQYAQMAEWLLDMHSTTDINIKLL